MGEPADVRVAPEVDRLYTLVPEDFVGARDLLARELRAAGDRESSDRVKALRRPTMAAWALNQAARSEPEAAAALASVAGDLRDAQEQALTGGDASALRDAARRKRDAIFALTAAASDALTSAGRDARTQASAVSATLEAAASDPEVAALLVAGRLAGEPAADSMSGFSSLLDLDITAQPRPPRGPRITGPPSVPAAGSSSERSARRKAVGIAQWDHEQALLAVAKSQAALDTARDRALATESDVDRLRRRLAEAEHRAAEAGGRLAAAEERHEIEQSRAAEALEALENARGDLGE